MRMLLLALLVAISLAGCGGASVVPVVGVVDMQRAMRECNDGQLAMANLRSLFEIRQRELDQRQGYLRAMAQQIQTQQAAGTDTSAMEAQYQRDYGALQQEFAQFQAELERGEQAATADIVQRLSAVLTELAAQRGIDVVIDRQEVPTVSARVVDLTSDLVSAYDARASLPPSSALVH